MITTATIYLTTGLLFTLWAVMKFGWESGVSTRRKLLSVILTTLAWPALVILLALNAR